MCMFDYETAAREAGIPPDKLEELSVLIRRDYPRDDMLFELHMLRACLAVEEGRLSIDEILETEPEAAQPVRRALT